MPAETALETGWVRHQNPLGFTVVFPRGSEVETHSDAQIRIVLPQDAGFLLVQPFLTAEASTPTAQLKTLLTRLSPVFPQVKIEGSTDLAEANTATCSFSFRTQGQEYRGQALCYVLGTTGILYATTAPTTEYSNRRTLLARIAASFQFTESRLPTPPPVTPYQRWTEPNEGMFSLEVPEGWQVTGGVIRVNSLDTRYSIRAEAPDGLAFAVIGDSQIPPYALLTTEGETFGMREGMSFDPGTGTAFRLRRYLPGLDFARDYVQTTLARDLPNVSFTKTAELTDLAQKLYPMRPDETAFQKEGSLGAVEFAATRAGKPWKGYCLAGTVQTQVANAQSGVWTVNQLYGYSCEAEREAESQNTLYRMVSTLRIEEDWLAQQPLLTARFRTSFAEEQQQIAEAFRASFRNITSISTVSQMRFGMTEHRNVTTGQVYRFLPGTNIYWHTANTSPNSVSLTPLTRTTSGK
jgi:hypothetical protein